MSTKHLCFCLICWSSTNVLVTTGGLRKGPHLGGGHLTIEGRKQCDTRASWYGSSFFNINFFFSVLAAYSERNIFSPVVELC